MTQLLAYFKLDNGCAAKPIAEPFPVLIMPEC